MRNHAQTSKQQQAREKVKDQPFLSTEQTLFCQLDGYVTVENLIRLIRAGFSIYRIWLDNHRAVTKD